LSEQRASDVIVVGGGVIGLACAWRAAQKGLAVTVLERERPGAGASSVAAGRLAPVTESHFGEERLLQLNLAAAEAYPAVAAELEQESGHPVGYQRCGALALALDRDDVEELKRLEAFQRSLGLEVEWLLPGACRELEPGLSTACAGGLWAASEGAVDPRALTTALAAAAERAGASIHQGEKVTRALIEGERITAVETEYGTHYSAGQVVLAAGSWSGELEWLPEHARPPVRPVKGQLLRLRALDGAPLCRRLVRSPFVYLVPHAGGRAIVGATTEERGFDTTVTAGAVHELLREAYRLLPEIAELELEEAIAGLRPGTPDNAPIIGQGAIEGLLLATGHYRNGILLAPVTGDAIAALLVGETPPVPIDACAPDRFVRTMEAR
jgi:glycine oxidase